MSFIFKPCINKKRRKKRQSRKIHSYYDVVKPVESEITNESSMSLNDVHESKNTEDSSSKSGVNECVELNAENKDSSLSIESVVNNHEITSSEDQDNSASESVKVQPVDSLNNLKTILSYSVLSSPSDMEEERSRSNRHSSESFNNESVKILNEDEESRDTSIHEELAEDLKVSDTSIELAHKGICLKSGVDNEIENGAMRKLNENSKTIIGHSNNSFTELCEIVPAKETLSVNIVSENQMQNEVLVKESVGIIDSQISTVEYIEKLSENEFEETKSSESELSKEIENAIKKSKLLHEGHCEVHEGDNNGKDIKNNLLRDETQNSLDLEIQNFNSNDEICPNFPTSDPVLQSKSNVCYGLTVPFEKFDRKNIDNDEIISKKERNQIYFVDSNSFKQSINFKEAKGIINQVVGDLLCAKPEDVSKLEFEENSTNSLDCCGDCVSSVLDSPATKEMPCRLAAVLERDQTQLFFNISKPEKNYNKMRIDVEQIKSSRNKRSSNVLLNSLEHESLSQDIKTNINNESLKDVIDESENSIENKNMSNINKTSDFNDSEAEPIIPQHRIKEIDIKHNTSSPNSQQNSLSRDSLLSNSNECCNEEAETLENIVGDASSSLLVNKFLNIGEDINTKRKDSNDNIEKMSHKESVDCTYTDGRNGKSMKSNKHNICSTTDEKTIPIRFESHQISNFKGISENTQFGELSSFENQPHVQSDSESTMIKEDDTRFDKFGKYVINRDDIRVKIQKIIIKAVNILQLAISKVKSHENLETKLVPMRRNSLNINKQFNRFLKYGYSNDLDGNLEYKLPYEEFYFKENWDELTFAQESTSCNSSSSAISQFSNKVLLSNRRITDFAKGIGYVPSTYLSMSSDNESELNDIGQYLKSSSISNCLRPFLNTRALNRSNEHEKETQDRSNETNNSESISSNTEDIACPVCRPSEQGDIGNSDTEEEHNLASETNVAFGDADIKNGHVQELINCRVPTSVDSSVGFINNKSAEKHVNSQVAINLNPRRGNLVVKCRGNFKVIPEEKITCSSVTSKESISVISPSEYTNHSSSPPDCSIKKEKFEKTNAFKYTQMLNKNKIENLIQQNLNLFKMYKSEALKPMKQPTQVMSFPKKQNIQLNMNRIKNKKSSEKLKTKNLINSAIENNDSTIVSPESDSSARHQEISLNSEQQQKKWLDKFRKLNNLLNEEKYLFSPKSTLPRTPPKSKISKDILSPNHTMHSAIISENPVSKVLGQKIAIKRTIDYLNSPTSKSRKLGADRTPYCNLEDSITGLPSIDNQLLSTRLKSPELNQKFDKNFKRYAKKSLPSGDLISYQTSTDWLRDAGLVGQVLTAQEADNFFKRFAGSKITVNKRDYKDFLQKLARRKKLTYKTLYKSLCQASTINV